MQDFSDFESALPIKSATALVQGEILPGSGSHKTELRPTLIVGLGGSGHAVLTHLKARYQDSFGEEVFNSGVLKLLAFDTADEVLTTQSERFGTVSLERSQEFIWIGGVQVQSIMNNLDKRPFIREWFPKDFSPRNITQGAQQVRPLGRLALFENFTGIAARLEGAINVLMNVRGEGIEREFFTVPPSTGINIYVVSSICGGTGSGMIFDVAYILRNICKKRGLPFYRVNGYLVMPQAFSNVPSEAIQANAFAALRELDYFNEFGKFEATYPTETVRMDYERPFDICYLMDGVNERSRNLSGMTELAPVIAEAIFLQAASQVGQANDSAFDNVKVLGGTDSGRPTAYSSVGTASLYFPANGIIEICAARYGQQLVLEGLLANPPNPNTVELQVKNFLGGSNLDPAALLAELQRAGQGGAMIIRLDSTTLPEVSPNDTLGQVDTLVTDFEQNFLNGLYRTTLEGNRATLQNLVNTRLTQEIRRYMDNSKDYGLLFTIGFLDRLKSQLTFLAQTLDRERVSYSTTFEGEQADVAAIRSNIISAVNSGPLGRGGKIKRAKAEYLEAKQRSCGLFFETLTRQQAFVLVSNLLSTVGGAQSTLTRLLDHLRTAADNLDRSARSLMADKGSSLSPLTLDITGPADVSDLYKSFAVPSPQALSLLLERTGGLYTWVNQGYSQVEARLLDFTRSIFYKIQNVKISDIINKKRHEQSPEARLNKLLQDALPFWNYERARLEGAGELETIMVLGDEDNTHSIFQLRKAMNIISTRDPHRIMVLNTKHGLPLFALRQFPDYRERYNAYKRRNISPLHLFPNLAFNDDKGEKEAWQLFALGEIFEMIRPTGVNDYEYVFVDPLRKPARLGQGLSRSLAGFAQNEDVRNEVESRVQQQWLKIGRDTARQKVQTYIEAGKPLSSTGGTQLEDLRITLRMLARDYVNRLDS